MSSLTTGLVSYYKLDANAKDCVGSNDGTVSGATLSNSGKINGCYYTDGTNDYIDTNITFNTTPLTIAFWINPTTISSTNYRIASDSSSGNNAIEFMYDSSNHMKVLGYWGSTYQFNFSGTTVLSTGTWYFIVLTIDTNSAKLYVNGSLEASDTSVVNRTTAERTFLLGKWGSNAYYSNQYFDEIGIWSRALSSTEVTTLYNSGDGYTYPFTDLSQNMISYWKADDSGSFPDALNNFAGTIVGATYSSSGKINGCYDFDGSNDRVDVSSFSSPSTSYSINIWFKSDVDQTSGDWNLLYRWQNGTSASNYRSMVYYSGYGAGELRFLVYDGNDHRTSLAYTSAISKDVWHMGTFVVDVSNTKLIFYLDGSNVKEETLTVTPKVTATTFCIGDRTPSCGADEPFNGKIDEIGFWGRVLSSTEISNLYNSGSGLAYPFSSSPGYGGKIWGVTPKKIWGVTPKKIIGV